ncbi:MAG TPA: hypothetical protein VMU62_01900 [Acidobacteriaceae bacterium]|nr:hypothetical protein [Acidobacteriaceae bacterium]
MTLILEYVREMQERAILTAALTIMVVATSVTALATAGVLR